MAVATTGFNQEATNLNLQLFTNQEATVAAIFLKREKFTTYSTNSRRYWHGSK
jgi:hypothetical protein